MCSADAPRNFHKTTTPTQDLASLTNYKGAEIDPAQPQHVKQAAKTGPLERYRSTAHSFPDYGSRRGAVKMTPTVLKSLNQGLVGPINTLNGPFRGLKKSASSISISSTEGPSQKRPRISNNVESANYSEQRFQVINDDDSLTAMPTNPHDRGVSEFRTAECYLNGRRGAHRRSRKGSPAIEARPTARFLYFKSNGQDDEDELSRDMPQDYAHAQGAVSSKREAARPRLMPGDGADSRFQRRFQTRKSTKQTGNRRKRSVEDISDDELQRPVAKIVKTSLAHPRVGVPSPSAANNVRPAQRPANSREEVNHVSVVSARCEPHFLYESNAQDNVLEDTSEEPCQLRPMEGFQGFGAIFKDGRRPSNLSWMDTNFSKVQQVLYHGDSSIVKVHRPADAAKFIGAQMMLKFGTPAQAVRFVEMFKKGITGPDRCFEKPAEKLDQEWKVLCDLIGRAIANKKLADSKAGEVSRPQTIQRVLERSEMHKNGSQKTAKSTVATDQPRSAKPSLAKEMMAHIPEVSVAPREITSDDREIVPQRRQRTRQTDESKQRTTTSPIAIRWTEANPGWDANWLMPLQFNRTTVNKEDIVRLDEGECLNDNLISFGLHYYFDKFEKKQQNIKERVHLHNSFFYEKLKAVRGKINYDGVKSWTARAKLLDKDYIVVPVNEHFHWWVAIICNPGKVDPDTVNHAAIENESSVVQDSSSGEKGLEVQKSKDALYDAQATSYPNGTCLGNEASCDRNNFDDNSSIAKREVVELLDDEVSAREGKQQHAKSKKVAGKFGGQGPRKFNLGDPRIVTLDSLGTPHYPVCSQLKNYIAAEFKDKKNKIIDNVSSLMATSKAANIPEQDNFCDCGVYLLGYFKKFVKNPDAFIQNILQRDGPKWHFDASALRNELRDIILSLQKTFQEEQLEERRKRADAKRKRLAGQDGNKPSSRETTGIPGGHSPATNESAAASPKTSPPASAQSDGARSGHVTPPSSMVEDSPRRSQKGARRSVPSPAALRTGVPKSTKVGASSGLPSPTQPQAPKSHPADLNGEARNKSRGFSSRDQDIDKVANVPGSLEGLHSSASSHPARSPPVMGKPNVEAQPTQWPPRDILPSTEAPDEEVQLISKLPDTSPSSDKPDQVGRMDHNESASPGSTADRDSPFTKVARFRQHMPLSSNVPEVSEVQLLPPSSAASPIDLTEDAAIDVKRPKPEKTLFHTLLH